MHAPAASIAPASASFREVWLISLGHGLTHWYPATFYLLLPIIGKELGLSYTQIGFIMTVQHAVGAIANIPGGAVVDAMGRKGLLMAISLFWIGFPYLLMAFTHSYWMLVTCMILIGIGNNLWHPAALSTLGQRFPNRKGLAMSLHGMGGNFGEALAPLLIGALLVTYSWRSVVIINLLPGLVMAVALLVLLGKMNLDHGKDMKSAKGPWTLKGYCAQLRTLFSDRALVLISLCAMFRTAAQSALLTFLPLYLTNNMGYTSAGVGVALFTLQACAFASAPLAGYASDRLGRKSVLTGGMFMTALVIAALATVGDSVWVIFLIALLGFFMYATRPVIQAWSLETAPASMAGTAVGILFGVQALGAAISPLAGGGIADAYGLRAAFYFLTSLIVIANVLVLFIPEKRTEPAPA
jgi:MFS family permease